MLDSRYYLNEMSSDNCDNNCTYTFIDFLKSNVPILIGEFFHFYYSETFKQFYKIIL